MDEKRQIVQEARIENLPSLLDFVEEACHQVEADQGIRFDLRLAVEEACVNLIRHGYAGMPPGPIRLSFHYDARKIIIHIGDHAPPFVPERVSLPNLDLFLKEEEFGGFGLYLIHQVIDEVSYLSDPEEGNLLTFIKWLPS